ncbi:hypothetical protein [Streptomyces sp. SID11385]|uniref:hypothetical protein n=1 Tax=Streptomyces sp. SID11385 TaxID=2706031 RepID=UPI0013CAB2CD|nr:hypothetical protein [Streptomyces sp. SID11385]NEA44141.1 hypothetical protein [Streptomyces sp. SID11385]
MTSPNPYGTPEPSTTDPAPGRPLHKRVLVWVGGTALLLTGALIGSAGDDGQETVAAKAAPATTVTARATVTATATPEPAPTVTKTMKAKPEPAPTVTVTVTKTARASTTTTGSSGGSTGNSTGSGTARSSTSTCSIVSNAGNCYSAGHYCRNSDHGARTSTAAGTPITCSYRSNAWRWTY